MAVSTIREHRPIHVFEMMERLGIEPSSSVAPRSTLNYATAVHRCRYWLDHAPAFVCSAPHFCPDADILFELQFDQIRPTSATTSKSFA